MRVFQIIAFVTLAAGITEAAHNCSTMFDKNHGYGCNLSYLSPGNVSSEINIVTKDDKNKTNDDIEWLQILVSNFDELPKGVFERFKNMKRIFIKNCTGVKKLDEPLFDSKIEWIYVRYTDLEEIGERAFEGLFNVTTLTLNLNKISKIHKNAFSDLKNMSYIEMTDNNIESLDDDIFANNLMLGSVLLDNNKIVAISAQLFSRNTKLLLIQLKNNLITMIDTDLFKANLTELIKADFTSNVCVDEKILITSSRASQWPRQATKFKECSKNYAMMKSTIKKMNALDKDMQRLNGEVAEAVEKVNNDMKIMEGKMNNSADFESMKTDLLNFFNKDKDAIRNDFNNSLMNISDQTRVQMGNEIKNELSAELNKSQNAKLDKWKGEVSETLREEYSAKFSWMYFLMAVTVLIVAGLAVFMMHKSKLFPILRYQNDQASLISTEGY